MKSIIDRISVQELRKRLSRLLDRVEVGESLTITRNRLPVAMLVPVPGYDPADQERRERAERKRRQEAEEAVKDLIALRKQVRGASLEELMASVHEGHEW